MGVMKPQPLATLNHLHLPLLRDADAPSDDPPGIKKPVACVVSEIVSVLSCGWTSSPASSSGRSSV
ncbi:hypothetical protein X975_03170, partial [Stegodyphus mimosarum]